MTYQVGKYYEVPCAVGELNPNTGWWYFGSSKSGERWMPVMLPAHEDREIINFPVLHFHFNLQFVPTPFFNQIKDLSGALAENEAAYAQVLIIKENMQYRIENRRLKCKRPLPNFPRYRANGKPLSHDWPRLLSKKYQGEQLRNGHICPHRGADLSHISPDKNGCVTCPLHGLVFGPDGICLGEKIYAITAAPTAQTTTA